MSYWIAVSSSFQLTPLLPTQPPLQAAKAKLHSKALLMLSALEYLIPNLTPLFGFEFSIEQRIKGVKVLNLN